MEWVTSEHPKAETWRRLLQFTNEDVSLREIVRRHGEWRTDADKGNYRKHARQIRSSILQAHDYFKAAEVATLATRPNLIFYGIVALSTAAMLISGGGDYALDRLRRDRSNMSHGLSFTTDCTASLAATDTNLLKYSVVKVHQTGHFANWYSTLPAADFVPAVVRKHFERHYSDVLEVIGGEPRPSLEAMVPQRFSVDSLTERVPDLIDDHRKLGRLIDCSRANVDVSIDHRNAHEIQRFVFRIHGLRFLRDPEALLSEFRTDSRFVDHFLVRLDEKGQVFAVEFHVDSKDARFHFPSLRLTRFGDAVLLPTRMSVPECAETFLLFFGLSMLSRYYPDLWFAALEARCGTAHLVDSLCDASQHRVPQAFLSLMAGYPIFVSHLPCPRYEGVR